MFFLCKERTKETPNKIEQCSILGRIQGPSHSRDIRLKVLCLLSFKKVGAKKGQQNIPQSFPFSTGSFPERGCKTWVFPVFHHLLHNRWRKSQRRFSLPLPASAGFSTIFTPPTTTTRIVISFCVQNTISVRVFSAKRRQTGGKPTRRKNNFNLQGLYKDRRKDLP